MATRIAWTAIGVVLDNDWWDRVVAGTDAPNLASFAVMRRLGIRYLRDVDYPLGPCQEYVRRRGDRVPDPVPERVRIVG